MAPFLTLPPELLIDTLRRLDAQSLARSRVTCSRLRNVINNSLILQYSLLLGASGLIETPEALELPIDKRLGHLQDLNRSWRILEARNIEEVALRPDQTGQFPTRYQLHAGYMLFHIVGKGLYILKLTSGGSFNPTITDVYGHSPFGDLECFIVDPVQDLLIVGTSEDENDGSIVVWHVRKLSAPDTQHPLAQDSRIVFPNPFSHHETMQDCALNICIRGDTLAAHIVYTSEDGGTSEAVVMFDWKSGFIESQARPSPVNIDPPRRRQTSDGFHILTDNSFLLFCMNTDTESYTTQPSIELYSRATASSSFTLRAAFDLPAFRPDVNFYHWVNRTDVTSTPDTYNIPNPLPGPKTDHFVGNSANGILSLTILGSRRNAISGSEYTTRSCELIIQVQMFIRWLSQNPHDPSNPPTLVPWEDWGPPNTRAIELEQILDSFDSGGWCTRQCTSGSRFIQTKTEHCHIHVMDFNPHEVSLFDRGESEEGKRGRTRSSAESFTSSELFDKPMRTTLPYVEGIFYAEIDANSTHGIVYDQDRIVTILKNEPPQLVVYAL